MSELIIRPWSSEFITHSRYTIRYFTGSLRPIGRYLSQRNRFLQWWKTILETFHSAERCSHLQPFSRQSTAYFWNASSSTLKPSSPWNVVSIHVICHIGLPASIQNTNSHFILHLFNGSYQYKNKKKTYRLISEYYTNDHTSKNSSPIFFEPFSQWIKTSLLQPTQNLNDEKDGSIQSSFPSSHIRP